MSDLAVTNTDVALVASPRYPRTYPAGAAVSAGAPVYLDSSGYVVGADADAAGKQYPIGVAVTTASAANLPVTVAGPDAKVDLGDALGGMSMGDPVYLSTTAGTLATTDTTGSAALVGLVIPAFGATTADKLLQVSGALRG